VESVRLDSEQSHSAMILTDKGFLEVQTFDIGYWMQSSDEFIITDVGYVRCLACWSLSASNGDGDYWSCCDSGE
jgi:hypothetical protein